MSDLMSPRGVEFQPVSPALITVRLIGNAIFYIPVSVLCAVLAVVISPYLWAAVVVSVALLIWSLWLTPRQVRAMGFAEGEDEFMIRRGILFRKLTLIPYGRIQYVDVEEGPIARKFGIARIKMNTASAQTDAGLEGLPVAEASRLRDMLARRGSAELAGL